MTYLPVGECSVVVAVVGAGEMEAVEGGKESGDWECRRWETTLPTLDTGAGEVEGAVEGN